MVAQHCNYATKFILKMVKVVNFMPCIVYNEKSPYRSRLLDTENRLTDVRGEGLEG